MNLFAVALIMTGGVLILYTAYMAGFAHGQQCLIEQEKLPAVFPTADELRRATHPTRKPVSGFAASTGAPSQKPAAKSGEDSEKGGGGSALKLESISIFGGGEFGRA